MTTPISTPPWDLAAGNRWTIQSEDHRIANDRGNETVVDANGTVIAYVAGGMENGNGALLAAAPALVEALKRLVAVFDWAGVNVEASNRDAAKELTEAFAQAGAALKQAGQP